MCRATFQRGDEFTTGIIFQPAFGECKRKTTQHYATRRTTTATVQGDVFTSFRRGGLIAT
jgi:hypothetical protein